MRAFQVPDKFGVAHFCTMNACLKVEELERFDDIVPRARHEGFRDAFAVLYPGEHDDGHEFVPVDLSDVGDQFYAGHFRHLDVEQ